MEISNMRGKVAFSLVHAYSVVPPNSDYTSSLISPGLGYSSNLDGTIISAAFPVKYCLCSRSPLCQISKFREDFRNSYVSDSNIFLIENAYYRPTLPFASYFTRSSLPLTKGLKQAIQSVIKLLKYLRNLRKQISDAKC